MYASGPIVGADWPGASSADVTIPSETNATQIVRFQIKLVKVFLRSFVLMD
jgi:hypothetical protein